MHNHIADSVHSWLGFMFDSRSAVVATTEALHERIKGIDTSGKFLQKTLRLVDNDDSSDYTDDSEDTEDPLEQSKLLEQLN